MYLYTPPDGTAVLVANAVNEDVETPLERLGGIVDRDVIEIDVDLCFVVVW